MNFQYTLKLDERDVLALTEAAKVNRDMWRAYAAMINATEAERELYKLKAANIDQALDQVKSQVVEQVR